MTEGAKDPVTYEFRDGAAWITLADAEHGNAFNNAGAAALWQAIRRARADRAPVVVLSAEGRFFSVGGDLASFGAADDMSAHLDDLADALHRIVSELMRLDAVVISVVRGTAAGAGFPLAAAADLVLAARSARFTLGYTRVGLTVDGGTSLLSATLGLHQALHLALLNPVLSAEDAHRAGLVAQVHDDDELGAAVDRVVAQLVAGPHAAQVAVKRLLRGVATPAPETALRREALAIREAAARPDGREGVRAFLDKRTPIFPGNTVFPGNTPFPGNAVSPDA